MFQAKKGNLSQPLAATVPMAYAVSMYVRHRYLCYLCLTLCSGLLASFGSAQANPRIIGILGGEQNQNLHASDPVLDAFMASDVPLYNKPHDKTPLLSVKGREIYADTYNLNRRGPTVYGFKKFAWYMVGYGERAYWMTALPNIHLYRYEELIRARASFIQAWDGKLYKKPGKKPEMFDLKLLPAHRRTHPPVEVADMADINGEPWVRIKILDSQCYEFDRPSKVVETGWVPAFQPDNQNTIWFDSKQCK